MVRCSKLSSDFSKTIFVDTNDPNMPKAQLICKGHILEPMRVDPVSQLNIGRVGRSAQESRKVTLARGDGPPIHPALPSTPDANFETSVKELEPGEKYELEVKVRPADTGNRVTSVLKIATGIADAPEISYPVYASFIPDVEPLPENFKVPVQRDADWEQVLELVWNTGEQHRILTATPSDSTLTVEVREEAGRQKVVLKVPQSFSGKGRFGQVILTTDDPKNPKVEVPILVMASAANRAATRRDVTPNQVDQAPEKAPVAQPSDR
jgi:hypothetical protein